MLKKIILAGFFCLAFSAESILDTLYIAPQLDKTIKIDGLIESDWDKAQWDEMNYSWLGLDAPDSTDFFGKYKVMWDSTAVYLLFEITDDSLSDVTEAPLSSYWNDDCIEIFIDENKDGASHLDNYTAFAYHVSKTFDVVDIDENNQPILLNDHIETARTAKGDIYTWEMKLKVFDDTFNPNSENIPVKLMTGKKMGFSIAYCDNDGGSKRENFMGSVNTEGHIENYGYAESNVFGTLQLEIDQNESILFSSTKYDVKTMELNYAFSQEGETVQIFNSQGKWLKSFNSEKGMKLKDQIGKGSYFISIKNTVEKKWFKWTHF